MPQQVDPFIPISPKKPSQLQGQYGAQWLRKSVPKPPAVAPAARPLSRPAPPPRPDLRAVLKPPHLRPPTTQTRPVDGIITMPSPKIPSPHHHLSLPSKSPAKPAVLDIIRPAPRPNSPTLPLKPSITPASHPAPAPKPPAAQPKITAPAPDPTRRTFRPKFHLPSKVELIAIIFGAIGAGLSIQILPLGELVIALYAIYALLRRVPSRTSFLLALIALGSVIASLAIKGESTLSQNFAVYAFLLLAVGTVSLALEVRRQPA